MRLKVSLVALLVVLIFTPLLSHAQSPSSSEAAGNSDLTKVKPPADLPTPDDSWLLGYHFWPLGVDHVLLGPFNSNQDPNAKQKVVVGPRTIYFYQAPDNTPELEVIQQYEQEIQQAGGAIGYQCDNQTCGMQWADVGHACAGLVGWFLHDGDTDPLYSMIIQYQQMVPKQPQTPGTSYAGNQFEDFGMIADWNDPKVNDTNKEQPSECHFFTAIIPANATQGPRYVSVAVVNQVVTSFVPIRFIVDVVQDNSFVVKTTSIDADTLAQGIQSQGHIALYGIYFDFDKSVPKAGSSAQIEQIADLLKAQPQLKVLIVGHTDNQGGYDYNISLSMRRAQAIVAILTKDYGIEASRMTAAGDGMTAPVASNLTDAGRAKNRRVELVQQ